MQLYEEHNEILCNLQSNKNIAKTKENTLKIVHILSKLRI